MRHRGVIEARHRGVGIIASESIRQFVNDRESRISFSIREVLNGGEEDLVRGRPVTFDVVNGRAVCVYLPGVQTLRGKITKFADSPDSWIITEHKTQRQVQMHFANIFKALPSIIAPGEGVSYTRHPDSSEAFNIRFPGLAPLSGVISSYSDNNGKGVVSPDGWNEDVIFAKAAFTNQPYIRVGMRVTFALERACPMKLRKSGIHAIQATRMRVDAAEIQEVDHPDAPQRPEHLTGSVANPPRELVIKDEGRLPDDGNSFTAEGCSASSELSMRLIHLAFSRNPEPFHDILQDLMLENGGMRLLNGAYLLVPSTYHGVIEAQLEADRFGCGDVIVTEDLADHALTAVKSLPRRYRVNERSRQTIAVHVPDVWEELVGLEGEQVEEQEHGEKQSDGRIDPMIVLVKRTFITIMLPSSLFSAPSGGPRTESDRTSAMAMPQNPRTRVHRNV